MEKLVRCFISIDLGDMGEVVFKEIARVQNVLSNKNFIGKLIPLDEAHLTLKFLGEIDEEKVKEVEKRLSEIKFDEFECVLDSIGYFNYRKSPRIIWIKIGGRGIFELQKRVDEVLGDLFPQEERFMSHLTIARVKYVKDKKGFVNHVKGIGLTKIKFKVKEFKLKESKPLRIGIASLEKENQKEPTTQGIARSGEVEREKMGSDYSDLEVYKAKR